MGVLSSQWGLLALLPYDGKQTRRERNGEMALVSAGLPLWGSP